MSRPAAAVEEVICGLCQEVIEEGAETRRLPCSHTFHQDCGLTQTIDDWMNAHARCPNCNDRFGVAMGDMPEGTLHITYSNSIIEFPNKDDQCRAIQVTFSIPAGTQGAGHPSPGTHYAGISRMGYFPDTEEGRIIVDMIKVAWERRLMFTIGHSLTRNVDNVIIYNGIHIRTDTTGAWGYPCATYLETVEEELRLKGIFRPVSIEEVVASVEVVPPLSKDLLRMARERRRRRARGRA